MVWFVYFDFVEVIFTILESFNTIELTNFMISNHTNIKTNITLQFSNALSCLKFKGAFDQNDQFLIILDVKALRF